MVNINIESDYGYVIAIAVSFWIVQFLFTIPIGILRNQTGIKPPTLYPTDKQITNLKLSPELVDRYMRAQRVHQNNMEFLVVYFPMLLLAGLYDAKHTAIAGGITLLGRIVTSLGYYYSANARVVGGWFHIPEFYTVYLAGRFAYSLITSVSA